MKYEFSVAVKPTFNNITAVYFTSISSDADTSYSLTDFFAKLRIYKLSLCIINKIGACFGVRVGVACAKGRYVGGTEKC